MAQEKLNFPLRRSSILRSGLPTNLYIPTSLKRSSVTAARDRYGWSLSNLVRQLLAREVKLKRGLVHARLLEEKK